MGGLQEMYSLAIARFDIPGDPGFPLNGMYQRPTSPETADLMRQYFLQLRHETGQRLCEKVFDTVDGKPSKWWTCFAKKRSRAASIASIGVPHSMLLGLAISWKTTRPPLLAWYSISFIP